MKKTKPRLKDYWRLKKAVKQKEDRARRDLWNEVGKAYSRILNTANRLNLVIKRKAEQIYLTTEENPEGGKRKRKLEEEIRIVTDADTEISKHIRRQMHKHRLTNSCTDTEAQTETWTCKQTHTG